MVSTNPSKTDGKKGFSEHQNGSADKTRSEYPGNFASSKSKKTMATEKR